MEHGNQSCEFRRSLLSLEFLHCLSIFIFSCRISVNQFKRVATSLACFSIFAKIKFTNATIIPFARTALHPLRLCTNIVSLVTHKHSYHNGFTAAIPAVASSPLFSIAHNNECADGVTYPGLAVFASLSIAASLQENSTFESDYFSGGLPHLCLIVFSQRWCMSKNFTETKDWDVYC